MKDALLYREMLDGMHCSSPGCDHKNHADQGIYIHANCHPHKALHVQYRHGLLSLECADCKKVVAKVVVGTKTDAIASQN